MPWVLQFIRGGALAALLTAIGLAVALLTAITTGTNILMFPLAAVAAVVYAVIPDRATTPQVMGSLFFGLVAVGAGLVSGFGALEISGVLATVVAVAVQVSRVSWKVSIPIAVIGLVGLVAIVANLVPLVADGGGLGHDESAYALKARHWIEDTPETGWSIHRGVAMSGYGYLVFQAGGDEAWLRVLGLTAIVGFAAATWVLGNRIGGRWVGPLSAVALVSSPVLLRRSTEYLSDVPSSALLVACMIVVWKQFGERDKPGYGLLWVLPFAWAAFYIRYQSVLSFALIAIAIGVLFWDKVRLGWRPIVTAAGLGLVGLIPHFVFATSEEGSPLGVLLFTADVAGREFFGEGLVDYFFMMGWPLAAFVGPVAVVFFIWWLVAGWDSVSDRTRCLYLMIPAVAQVLILGVLSHGEARFIFFPLALTLIGGVTGFIVVMRRWRPTTARVVSFGLAMVLLGSLAMSAAYVRRAVENRSIATDTVQVAAGELREMSGDESCGVVTSYFPQITFYSECYTGWFRSQHEPAEALGRVEGENRFLLLVEDGKNQPTGDELAGYIDLTNGDPLRVMGERYHADIYQFTP